MYLDHVQLETTRFYGPGTGIFLRKALHNTKIADIPIIKDLLVTIQPLGNQLSPKYFKEPN